MSVDPSVDLFVAVHDDIGLLLAFWVAYLKYIK